MKHAFEPRQFLSALRQLPSPCTIELPKDEFAALCSWITIDQYMHGSRALTLGRVEFNTTHGKIVVKSDEPLVDFHTKPGQRWKKNQERIHRNRLKRADREILEHTIQCRDTDAMHGEVKRIEKPETISYVLTADRGRVVLPATVVAHGCPGYGFRFVTEDGTCPDCGYLAYGQTSVAADDVPEDDTEKSEPTCDCGNLQPHVPNGLNCWRPV